MEHTLLPGCQKVNTGSHPPGLSPRQCIAARDESVGGWCLSPVREQPTSMSLRRRLNPDTQECRFYSSSGSGSPSGFSGPGFGLPGPGSGSGSVGQGGEGGTPEQIRWYTSIIGCPLFPLLPVYAAKARPRAFLRCSACSEMCSTDF